jgi:hypothetical protein
MLIVKNYTRSAIDKDYFIEMTAVNEGSAVTIWINEKDPQKVTIPIDEFVSKMKALFF